MNNKQHSNRYQSLVKRSLQVQQMIPCYSEDGAIGTKTPSQTLTYYLVVYTIKFLYFPLFFLLLFLLAKVDNTL